MSLSQVGEKSDRSHVVLWAKELDSRLVFLRPLGLRLGKTMSFSKKDGVKSNEYNDLEEDFFELLNDNEDCKFEEKCHCHKKGKIVVTCKLNTSSGEPIGGVTIKLFKMNGNSPILVGSKLTDSLGKCEFTHLENGNYRVVEIIEQCVFEKPQYVPCNEVNITSTDKFGQVLIINRIRRRERKRERVVCCDGCCGGCDGCCGGCDGCCRGFDGCCGGFDDGFGFDGGLEIIILFLLFGCFGCGFGFGGFGFF